MMGSNTSPLISIIVPVYNVEKYLDRCINSLLAQTYENYEVILIDDGSTDTSGEICDSWKEKDCRIRVVHKKNAGLGYARNSGLELVLGEYVIFVDSDDFVEKEMLEQMLFHLKKTGADTCYCSFQYYSNEKNRVISKEIVQAGVFSGKDVLLNIIGAEPENKKDSKKEMSVCACLFSAEIIRNNRLKFKSEREYICEDLPFDIEYLQKAEKVIIIDKPFYNYCINESSLTHRYYPDRIHREIKLYQYVCDALKNVYKEREYELRYSKLFLGRIRNCIIQEVKDSNNSVGEIIRNIRDVTKNSVVEQVIREYPIKKGPIKQKVFNICLKYKAALILYLLVLSKRG